MITSAVDQNVLEAIAHSLEFEACSIMTAEGARMAVAMNNTTLLRISGLSARDLRSSTDRLAAAGLIDCHETAGLPGSQAGWTRFWPTPEGRRRIVERDRFAADRDEEIGETTAVT